MIYSLILNSNVIVGPNHFITAMSFEDTKPTIAISRSATLPPFHIFRAAQPQAWPMHLCLHTSSLVYIRCEEKLLIFSFLRRFWERSLGISPPNLEPPRLCLYLSFINDASFQRFTFFIRCIFKLFLLLPIYH
jgi:hypothetical protein